MQVAYKFYEVHVPGQKLVSVWHWSDVLEMARASGWTASAVQLRFDDDGNEIDAIEIDAYHIEQDFMERAR